MGADGGTDMLTLRGLSYWQDCPLAKVSLKQHTSTDVVQAGQPPQGQSRVERVKRAQMGRTVDLSASPLALHLGSITSLILGTQNPVTYHIITG